VGFWPRPLRDYLHDRPSEEALAASEETDRTDPSQADDEENSASTPLCTRVVAV
jgi:hypothetical protein